MISQPCCKYHPRAVVKDDFLDNVCVCGECGLVLVEGPIEWKDLYCFKKYQTSFENAIEENSFDVKSEFEYVSEFFLSYKSDSIYNKYVNELYMETHKIFHKLNLGRKIMKETFSTIKQISYSEEIRKCHSEAIIYSCLFIACKKNNVIFSFKDICSKSSITKIMIGRTFKKIMRILIKKGNNISVRGILDSICLKLGVEEEIARISHIIVNKAVLLNIVCGRSPISILISAIYLAADSINKKIEIKEFEEHFSLSPIILKETLDCMSMHINTIIPVIK